jgi:hypothetical protein
MIQPRLEDFDTVTNEKLTGDWVSFRFHDADGIASVHIDTVPARGPSTAVCIKIAARRKLEIAVLMASLL